MGFCRVCGLLEHPSKGCVGPPDMSMVQVIGAREESSIVAARSSTLGGLFNSNPNPNLN